MKASEIWVVVVDSVQARVFSAESPLGALSEAGNLVHGEGRLRRQDLVSDDGGRAYDSQGSGRHAMEPKTDARTQEQLNFALEINQFLQSQCQAGAYRRLFLVAPPAMMGQLRERLSKQLQSLVVGTLNKNLAHLSPADIRGHLPEKLWMIHD